MRTTNRLSHFMVVPPDRSSEFFFSQPYDSSWCLRRGSHRAVEQIGSPTTLPATDRMSLAIGDNPMRSFKSLSEQEVLALAISLEEEDARIYDDFADGLKADYPATAEALQQMRAEEDGHRHRLIELHRQKFGEHIPLIRRQDIKGFVNRKPIWLVRPLGLADGAHQPNRLAV